MPYHQLVGLNTVEQHGASPNDAQLISRLSVWQRPLTIVCHQWTVPHPATHGCAQNKCCSHNMDRAHRRAMPCAPVLEHRPDISVLAID